MHTGTRKAHARTLMAGSLLLAALPLLFVIFGCEAAGAGGGSSSEDSNPPPGGTTDPEIISVTVTGINGGYNGYQAVGVVFSSPFEFPRDKVTAREAAVALGHENVEGIPAVVDDGAVAFVLVPNSEDETEQQSFFLGEIDTEYDLYVVLRPDGESVMATVVHGGESEVEPLSQFFGGAAATVQIDAATATTLEVPVVLIECCNNADCDDENVCTINTCHPEWGCVTQFISCDDGNACTIDSCSPTVGCVNTTLNCDDGDPCTINSCDPSTGCVTVPSPDC